MKKAIGLAIVLMLTGCKKTNYGKNQLKWPDISDWAYQLQDALPLQIATSEFDVIVMDYSRDGTEEGEYSRDEITLIADSGVVPIAYLSIGEAENYRFYWQDTWSDSAPSWLGTENPEWPGNYAVKYWDPAWQALILEYLRRIVVVQGFHGVYLDRVDEFEHWSDPENGEDTVLAESDAASKMLTFIRLIADSARSWDASDFIVIPQNGERLIQFDSSIVRTVSGWAAEDIFYDGTDTIPESERAERINLLSQVVRAGKPVLSVDYVDDGTGYTGENMDRIWHYIQLARAHGFVPYAARMDRELDNLNIIEGIQPPE